MLKYFVLLSLCLLSCRLNYKPCPCLSADEELCIYQAVLSEIVEKRTYNYYLGEDEERIFNAKMKPDADSQAIRQETIGLQHALFNDSARFAVLILDTGKLTSPPGWHYILNNTDNRLRLPLREFATDTNRLCNDLGTLIPYKAGDFKLCTAKLLDIDKVSNDTSRYYIGKICLSRISFNDSRDAGVMYLNFKCGSLCGKGELLWLKKQQNGWYIERSDLLWIN